MVQEEMIMKKENYTITLQLSEEQYVHVKQKADKDGVSIEGYTLYMVLHEEPTAHASTVDKLLISPAEACELLGIGRTVMYRLIKEGAVPAVKLPSCRRLYLSMDGIRKMIRDNTVSPSEIGGEVDE